MEQQASTIPAVEIDDSRGGWAAIGDVGRMKSRSGETDCWLLAGDSG